MGCYISFAQNFERSTFEVVENSGTKTSSKPMLVDEDGFLWYATNKGVVKEMGNHHKLYKIDPPPNVAGLGWVHMILKASNEKLWGVSPYGIFSVDIFTEEVRWYTFPEPKNPKRSMFFASILEDKKGQLWFGTTRSNHVYCYTVDGQFKGYDLTEYFTDDSPTNKNMEFIIRAKQVLSDGSVLFESNHRTEWVLFKEGEFRLLKEEGEEDHIEDGVHSIVENGKYFEENSSGTFFYKGSEFVYNYLPEIDKQVIIFPFSEVLEVQDGFEQEVSERPLHFVFHNKGTSNIGALRFNRSADHYELVEVASFDFDSEITNFVSDETGYLWVHHFGTITKIRPKSLGFETYLDDYKRHGLSTSVSCRALHEDSNGNIYMFSQNGLFKRTEGEKDFKLLPILEKETGEGLPKGMYNAFFENDSIVWAYGFNANLRRIDLSTNTSKHVTPPMSVHPTGRAYQDMERINENQVLIGSLSGLITLNLDTKTFQNANEIGSGYDLKNHNILDIYVGRNKKVVWIASINGNGVYKKDLTTGKVEHFSTSSTPVALISDNVRSIYEDTKGRIWFSTSIGVQRIDFASGISKTFRRANGQANDIMVNVLEYQGAYWISTFNGLLRLEEDMKTFEEYYVEDGLPNNEFNTKSSFRSSDGRFFFGGISGLVEFDPKAIESQKKAQFEIFLAQLDLFDEETGQNKTFSSDLSTIKDVIIPYSHNYANLTFVINDMFDPEKNDFEYRIKEVSADWVSLGNDNIVPLFGMEPGNYNLEVRGYSSRGIPTNTLHYKVRVEQIFYKQRWFLITLMAGVLLLGGFLFLRRQQHLRRQIEQQHKIALLEATTLRAQMNPHFLFNALNGLQHAFAVKGKQEVQEYFNAINRFLRLTVDMNLSDYIVLDDEVDYLRSYLFLERFRLNDDLEVVFDVQEGLDTQSTWIPTMLFQPIVENAIIHGLLPKQGDRKIEIRLSEEEGHLIGEVTDNGVGRKTAEINKKCQNRQHRSWATRIMNERIKLMKSVNRVAVHVETIDLINEGQAMGTKVVIKIPVIQNK